MNRCNPGPMAGSVATRRNLFGVAGAMMLLTAAEAGPAKAAELDGDLLTACAELLAIDAESDRLWATCLALGGSQPHHPAYQAHDDHWKAHGDRYWDLAERICHLPARTPEGLRWKAKAARSAMPADDWGTGGELVAAILDDMLGRAGA